MRDILVTLIIFGSIPFIFQRPFIGIVMWSWIGLMNPHRLCWGFAYNFQFAQVVAAATILSIVLNYSKNRYTIEWTREMKILLLFTAWMFITTQFAFNSSGAWHHWGKVWKIMLMTFLMVLVVQDKRELNILVWVAALSIGFYGVKGGFFTIRTGGGHLVLGPSWSFIATRGAIALALNMTIPLMRYLQLQATRPWVKYGLTGAMVLTAFATIGTHSRGGFLGAIGMGFMLLMKSRRRFFYALVAVFAAYSIVSFMPAEWSERMGTIENYEQDASAMGRINAWHFAYNMAKDNPVFGGGFESFRPWLFERYAPNPGSFHDAHNIFFEVLGEHGFVGLGLFCLLMLFTWRTCSHIISRTKRTSEAKWLSDLASMLQVSIGAYVIGGSFLGLAYFDYFYYLVALTVLSRVELRRYEEAGLLVEEPQLERVQEPGASAPPQSGIPRPTR